MTGCRDSCGATLLIRSHHSRHFWGGSVPPEQVRRGVTPTPYPLLRPVTAQVVCLACPPDHEKKWKLTKMLTG